MFVSRGMEKKRQRQGKSLKKVRDSIDAYVKASLACVALLSPIFGQKIVLGMIGFSIQPLLAIGQFIFGYSAVYTFLYVFAFNSFLLYRAKKMRSGGDK
jgi:hypothetical protein